MIDNEGYRHNVGIVITNHEGKVFWAKRIGQDAWQFPQGGVDGDEEPENTLFRELTEEVGLKSSDVTILGQTRHWLKYRLPRKMIRDNKPYCIGQKQKWFLLRLESPDSAICFNKSHKPEFDGWCWVNYWYPLREVISFKRDVYRRALKELAPIIFTSQGRTWGVKSLDNLLDT